MIRVGCLNCGMTTGCEQSAIRPCSLCQRSDSLVRLGPWEPQPGLFTIQLLWERGRLTTEAPSFGRAVRASGRRP